MARSNVRPIRLQARDDDSVDSIDVPAAVICAHCGRGDCSGCFEERSSASGVVAIVPWERGALPWPERFYATVNATTRGAEAFFGSLPDGAISPAFRFAVLAETFAVASTALLLTPLVVLGFPGLLLRFVSNAATQRAVAVSALIAVIGFTVLLVAAHALHGVTLGKGPSRSRSLRLGLYACGWDFGSSPAGFVSALVSGGVGAAGALVGASVTAPTRALDAALAGIFQLDDEQARKAKRRAMRIAMAISVPGVMAVLSLVALTALFL